MDKVRVGVIGVGAFGESHVATYCSLPYVTVAALCSRDASRTQEVAARYHVPRWHTDFHEMLAQNDLDAVSVVTNEDAHLGPTLAALQAGKHVLVEKPIATRLEDAEQMLSAARAAGLFLMPGHVLRFEARYARVKEQLASGELGRLVSVSAWRNRPKSQTQIYLRVPGFLVTSIHDLDLALWYTGDRVRQVRAFQRNSAGAPNPDVTFAIIEFAGGAIACLETLWLTPDQAGVALDDGMRLVGTRGSAHIDFAHAGLALRRESGHFVPDVSYEPRVRGQVFGALKEELGYFATCVLQRQPPSVVTAEEAVEGLRVALAIIQSAEQERDVTVE